MRRTLLVTNDFPPVVGGIQSYLDDYTQRLPPADLTVLASTPPEGLQAALPTWEVGQSLATRAASGKVLSALADVVPELWGGSSDLAGSNNTSMAGEPSFLPAALAQS